MVSGAIDPNKSLGLHFLAIFRGDVHRDDYLDDQYSRVEAAAGEDGINPMFNKRQAADE
jgi:hypothetical protein